MKAAESMFQTGYFVWSLFIGHLVLEKALKAIYVKTFDNKIPPKIHNLNKLASICNMNLDKEQIKFLDDVNNFHIEGRYSEFKNELYKRASKLYTSENLEKIKEQYRWFRSLIT
ncbi:MAG: HEPN domain-containing protein [FCB group bacterium]